MSRGTAPVFPLQTPLTIEAAEEINPKRKPLLSMGLGLSTNGVKTADKR
jgi:hypothetical protein